VTRDDGEGDVFVHQSDIYSQGFRSLRNQEPVEFGLEPIGDGRFKAVNVRALSSVRVTLERLRQTNPDLPVCSCDPESVAFSFFRLFSDMSTPERYDVSFARR
jgi:cold shock CspA family protein